MTRTSASWAGAAVCVSFHLAVFGWVRTDMGGAGAASVSKAWPACAAGSQASRLLLGQWLAVSCA